MASIVLDGITRQYTPGARPAVDSLNLDIADGEFLVLVGPSGCGKSTSLRMIAGLEPINSGRLYIGDMDATDVRPQDRDVAMVFQSYALYPNMSVRENMSFALKNQKVPKDEINKRVAEASRILQLDEYLDRKPAALSGGQRQRVAMGRAIVRDAAIFCMDEPLSNLDAKLRVSTRAEISALQRRLGVTTVYVTHDQVEAMTMGDRVAVLLGGVLQQVDKPQVLYDKPVNAFVASFIGSPSMNLLEGTLNDGRVNFATGEFLSTAETAAPGASVIIGCRPENMRLAESSESGLNAEVTHVDELGADSMVYARVLGTRNPNTDVLGKGVPEEFRPTSTPLTTDDEASLGIRLDRNHGLNRGDHIALAADPEHTHLFDPVSGDRF